MNDPQGTEDQCGVWDEEAQACYSEPCPDSSSIDETPAAPPPVPLPPKVRYVPKNLPLLRHNLRLRWNINHYGKKVRG